LFGARRRLAGASGGAGRAFAALRTFGAGRTVAQVWPCTPGWAFSPVRALSALRAFGTGRPRRAIITLGAVAAWRALVGFGAFAAVAPARSALVTAR
jgi:hypothetical protein